MTVAVHPAVFLGVGGTASRPRMLLPVSRPELPPPKRVRAKLWELNEAVHCSIIGTCLTTAELRRVMGKVLGRDVSRTSDHDLHSQAVGLCNHHNAGSKLLQKALDARHEIVVKRFSRITGEAAVLATWAEARAAGDIPGAYWAVLTHPDVGHEGLRRAFGDVHMLSHLVGAANRADIRRLTALEDENAALQDKVERQQLRLHEAITSRDATIRQLGGLAAATAHATMDPADGDPADRNPADGDALAGLRHLVADLQSRLARETARREWLEQRQAEAAEVAQRCGRRAKAADAECSATRRELLVLEQLTAQPGAARPPLLPAHHVLYVGGRPSAVEQMRALMVEAGGALLTHDGGRHDHTSLLAGLVGKADQVVFPVDCISHDAALTVKRLCRQLGKRFVPLRSSGLATFLAALCEPTPELTEASV